MKPFMDQDFLLTTETAKWLYHDVAEKLPIIDYHCHIPPKEIAENRKFENITQLWLGADHYKWRLMRANGVTEELVTGNGDDREKFRAFANVMPKLIGNPMYHWSHLELQRAFGIFEPLTSENADKIYDSCNQILKNVSARDFVDKFRVKALCTTDDPVDDLTYHEQLAGENVKVIPAFRPDRAINIEKADFAEYIEKLGKCVGYKLENVDDVVKALYQRIDYFAAHGCLCADHGMDCCMFAEPDRELADKAFKNLGNSEYFDAYKTYVTVACAKKYKELNWVMQLHFGCLRNTNKPQFAKLGPDTGYDTINSNSGVENLASLLNSFAENKGLPKTIVYSLNPSDNTAIDTVIASFQGGGEVGKMQHGSAWWFNDSRPGMRAHLTELAANGVLGNFVGMLTDSRSFISYTRHEYFRRVLCELIGEWVESGQYPDDRKQLAKLVEDICFNNTNEYFRFGIKL